MVASQNITPGMTLQIGSKMFRVESSVRVTVPKGTPFIKTKLRDLASGKEVEKNFKPKQVLDEVNLTEQRLEYLYMEQNKYVFLDIESLEQVAVPQKVVGKRANYLKEGVQVTGEFYGDTLFAIELPQFLELMVAKTDSDDSHVPLTNSSKTATLETGAKIEVPPFIEGGDIIKVDTMTEEYIQRV